MSNCVITPRETGRRKKASDSANRTRGEHPAQLADELKSILRSTSHALGTPVWTADEFCKMFMDQCKDKLADDDCELFREIQHSIGRIVEILHGTRKLARLCGDRRIFDEVCLSDMAVASIRAFQSADPGRDVRVDVQPGITVLGDAAQLAIVVDNLVRNAWEATTERNAAEISFGQIHEVPVTGGTTDVYAVSDNGVGFDEDKAKRLFNPFEQCHSKPRGTGMGLAEVRRIVNAHGGRVWASGEPNVGATVYFTLSAF